MLRKISVCWTFAFFVLVGCAMAQTPKSGVTNQRATQWKPEKGQYYFSHALTYSYENKEKKTKGEIVIYVDPVTGTMCFKRENSFGDTGKAFDFILAFQDGKYVYYGADESGKKFKMTEKVEELKPDAETIAQQKEDFSTYCIPTGNTRKDFGMESIEYDLSYPTSDNKDKLWLTKTPFGINPLYGFDLIDGVASLPVSFDYTHIFNNKQLLTELNSKGLILKLKSYEPNPFLAVTRGYAEVKAEN
jgi:hypothetical protein